MKRILCLAVATTLVCTSAGLAQDDEMAVPLEGTFNLQLSMGTGIDGGGEVLTFMQVDSGLPINPQDLVNVPRVIQDLQLVDSQIAEIRQRSQSVIAEFQRRREALDKKYGDRQEEVPEEYAREVSKIDEAQRKELEEIVKSVLLPFQRERLQQISAQARLRADGSNALASDEFAEALGLTEEQKKELAEAAEGFEQKLLAEYRELRKKRQREIIEKVLTPPQQRKLDELLGEELVRDQAKPDDRK
jgi:hypothetical protein